MTVRRETTKRSPAVGEYLIRVYTVLREGRRVVWARLAERMGVSPSAVTQAFQRMARDGLVILDRDSEVSLTSEGKEMAEGIIRRHYLIERLLVDELGYNWADADEEAEHLEHALSANLEAYLYERLGHPSTCPHGNPFPGSADEERLIQARKLSQARAGERVVIWRITEEGEDEPKLLHLMHDHNLLPGAEALVESVDYKLEALTLGASCTSVTLPLSWAQHVRVSEPLPS